MRGRGGTARAVGRCRAKWFYCGNSNWRWGRRCEEYGSRRNRHRTWWRIWCVFLHLRPSVHIRGRSRFAHLYVKVSLNMYGEAGAAPTAYCLLPSTRQKAIHLLHFNHKKRPVFLVDLQLHFICSPNVLLRGGARPPPPAPALPPPTPRLAPLQ